MRKLIPGAIVAILFWMAGLASAAVLAPGSALYAGQSIYSDNQQYMLTMQSDGNLVYYRVVDGAVRWNTGTWGIPGNFLLMQEDGNAVTYYDPPPLVRKKGAPIDLYKHTPARYTTWYSATSGNAGAYLKLQNDGNLVVAAANGQKLWGIGADPDLDKPAPKRAGDVVGRELVGWVAAPGHVGYFDGQRIYQVMNEPQVVQYVTVDNFRSTVAAQGPNAYWGAGYPNIPVFYVKGCFETDCTGNRGRVLDGRNAMTARALQILRLGAQYTLTASSRPSLPRTATEKIQMGSYRCDTYLMDIYTIFTGGGEVNARGEAINFPHPDSPSARWWYFKSKILAYSLLPAGLFQLLKEYRGYL